MSSIIEIFFPMALFLQKILEYLLFLLLKYHEFSSIISKKIYNNLEK